MGGRCRFACREDTEKSRMAGWDKDMLPKPQHDLHIVDAAKVS